MKPQGMSMLVGDGWMSVEFDHDAGEAVITCESGDNSFVLIGVSSNDMRALAKFLEAAALLAESE